MNKTNHLLAGGAAAVAVIALGALPVYTSRQVENRLTALAAQPMQQGDVVLRNLKHEAGFLHSKGEVDLVLRDHCSLDPDEADGATVHIVYAFSHLPGLSGINGFSWKATPTGPSVDAFSRLFTGNAELTGQGRVGWSGLVSSEMKLPAIAYASGGETIEVAPSEGTVAFGEKPLRFDWALARVVLRGKGEAMELKQLGVQLDLSDRQRGIGKVALKVGGFSNSLIAMEGISLTSDTSEHGDKLDSVLTQRIQHLRFANQDMKDLVLEAALKGVHAASVETLTTLVGSSCGMDRLTRDESDKARQALKTLINGGMSMGISRLSGQSAQGSVDGQLMLQLKANAKPELVALAQQLSSTGELSVKGGLLDAQQKLMAVSTGYVNETPEGIKAAYSYEGGLLKVNGKTLDASWLQAMLASLDEKVNRFLSGKAPESPKETPPAAEPAESPEPLPPAEAPAEASPAQAPAPVPPAEPALPAAPAPAPVSVPAQVKTTADAGCHDLGACVSSSLQSAWRGDVDALRQSASHIDALPKPDLGNKAQSRKLNTQALDALKAGDANQAVQLLQAAQRENPRDVEVASNLGFALVKAQRPQEAAKVLSDALLLDPRRTSTWAPLGEALALSGRQADGAAALWAAWQWSGNREKTETAFSERAARELAERPALAQVYQGAHAWVTQGQRPALKNVR